MSDIKACLSTGTDTWETPPDFFAAQERKYGKFDLDVCATAMNAKCLTFFPPGHDGLKMPWFGNVWCNPPYSKGQPDQWIKKALQELRAGRARQVVMLLRGDTSTKRWHDLIVPNATEFHFVRGRLRFWENGRPAKQGAAFPSVVVVFR